MPRHRKSRNPRFCDKQDEGCYICTMIADKSYLGEGYVLLTKEEIDTLPQHNLKFQLRDERNLYTEVTFLNQR